MKTIQAIVAANIKARMRELGLTQKGLADAMKTSQPTVNAWVNSETLPDKKSQEKLCKALDCPIERLLHVEKVNDLSKILNSVDKRLSAIEEALMPSKELNQKNHLKELSEKLKDEAAKLGISPYEALMRKIAEDDKKPQTSQGQTNLNQKKIP